MSAGMGEGEASQRTRRRRRFVLLLGVIALAIFLAQYVLTIYWLRQRNANLARMVRELAQRQQLRDALDSDRQRAEDSSLVRIGDPVPPFEVTALDGQIIRSEDLRGRVVLLNFFMTRCGPCQEEMPRLQADIWERFQSRGLVLVAVDIAPDDTVDAIRSLTKDCSFAVARDPKDAFGQFGMSVPRCYLISPEGRIRFMTCGFGKILEPEFQRLIKLVDMELERAASSLGSPHVQPDGHEP